MRLPRVRFTVRRLMVAVAVVAVALVFIIPAVDRVIWLYNDPNAPGSGYLFVSGYKIYAIRSRNRDAVGQPHGTPFPVGQAVWSQFSYQCEIQPQIPTGLPFRVSLVTNLMDPPFTVVESKQETYLLISGLASWKAFRRDLSCRFTPPRAGSYRVEHEISVTDLFGRKSWVGTASTEFEAQ